MHFFRLLSVFTAAATNRITLSYCCKETMTDIQRLLSVPGTNDKKNDLIYNSPENPSGNDGCLFFFGGDVQDFPEVMLTHRDNKRYVEWNLENTAKLLHKKFPNKKLFVVRPSRMHLKTFSCFDNFVHSNDVGSPEHSLCVDGLKHLCALYQNARSLTTVNDSQKTICPKDDSITLIGFSKGCVVLNQLLYAFAALAENKDKELENFVTAIREMYWLDGGHSGGSKTWITDKNVLQKLAGTHIRIHIHVTPYQVKDSSRPWNGKEEKIFRDTLKHLGVAVERKLHFEEEPRSLESHFAVLDVF